MQKDIQSPDASREAGDKQKGKASSEAWVSKCSQGTCIPRTIKSQSQAAVHLQQLGWDLTIGDRPSRRP